MQAILYMERSHSWSSALAWKAGRVLKPSRVRIPPSPPNTKARQKRASLFKTIFSSSFLHCQLSALSTLFPSPSPDPDHYFPKMTRAGEVAIRFLGLIKFEDAVDDGSHFVQCDCAIHRDEHFTRSDINPLQCC